MVSNGFYALLLKIVVEDATDCLSHFEFSRNLWPTLAHPAMALKAQNMEDIGGLFGPKFGYGRCLENFPKTMVADAPNMPGLKLEILLLNKLMRHRPVGVQLFR